MRKFLLSLLTLAATAPIVGAQENLLAGAIGTTVDNKEAFYNVWQVYDKDGNQITDDNKRMYSCFVKAYDSEYPNTDYEHKQITLPDCPEAFCNGNYYIIIKFPDKSYDSAPHYYSYPINIKEEGDYLLKGAAQCFSKSKTEPSDGHRLLHIAGRMAITFDDKVTPKTFSAENGKVVGSVGSNKVPTYESKVGSDENPGEEFSHTVHLTPGQKYMTIQAPACLLALGNLSLAKDGEVSINEFLTDDDTEPVFFDLQGRRAGTDASQLEKGIYIKKTGAKTEKVAIR